MRINRDGTCTYRGRTYATLREALLVVWRRTDEVYTD